VENAEILRIGDIDTASSTLKHFQAKWIPGSREENALNTNLDHGPEKPSRFSAEVRLALLNRCVFFSIGHVHRDWNTPAPTTKEYP
jgi:hypothetical protein